MTTTVSAVEARKNLGKLLNIVSLTREDVVIERAGKKIARLSSCDTDSSRREGKLNFLSAKGIGKAHRVKGSVDEYIARERDEWN